MSVIIDFIPGMPPVSYTTAGVVKNTMPTATITPCLPNFKEGLQLFGLNPTKGMELYNKLLKTHGFELPTNQKKLKIAFLADAFPTDTFSNEYGESFLDKFTRMASSGLAEISQFMGASTISEAAKNIGGALGEGSLIGKAALGGHKKLQELQESLKARQAAGSAGAGLAKKMLNVVSAGLAGARVDFPKVWKNSAFEPSYTMTIRLYNPSPGDPDMTRKYIVGPLAAILILGLPRGSADNSGYQWPFLCKVRANGIYDINAAFINSISVIKGGDQQSIAWNQALSIVDVRIDFGSLYNSILVEEKAGTAGDNRPTLNSYLNVLGGKDNSISTRTLYKMYNVPGPASTSNQSISHLRISEDADNFTPPPKYPGKTVQSPEVAEPAPRRVSVDDQEKAVDFAPPVGLV
jgi:hypothetical protein